METNKRSTGTVKWYNFDKGYGFIRTAEELDVFVHYSACPGERLTENDQVSFDMVSGPKGPQAFDVRVNSL